MSKEKNNESKSHVEANADIRNNILSGAYTLNYKDGRSKIWKYFVKITDDRGEEVTRKVCCILCYTVLSYNPRTTSNLLRHRCYSKETSTDETTEDVHKTLPLATKRILTKLQRIKNYKSTCHYIQENTKIKVKILSGTFKLRKKVSRCKIWKIFAKIEDSEGNEVPKKVCCKTCYAVLNQNAKCTSNLVKHKCYIKASVTAPASEKRTISSRVKEIERNQNKEAELLNEVERSHSLIELVEEPLSNEFSETRSINNNSTVNDLKAKAVKIFSQWCIESFRPFELAKDVGLRKFIEFLISETANYGTTIDIDNVLPDALTISQSIESQFNAAYEKLRNEIERDCKYGYGLTSKLWYNDCCQEKYIILTIHYVKKEKLISKFLGLNVMHKEENMYGMLEIKLLEILSNYNFTYKDSIIAVDGDCNVTTALKNFNHIKCINHILNNVIERAIQEVEELKELYNQCLKLKKYFTDFHSNCDFSAIFKNACLAEWNASYYLLDAIEKNWLQIQHVLQQNNESQKIKNIQKKRIEDVIRILKPFEHASKILEGEEYPTIHLVYAYVNGLKDACLGDDEDNNDDIIRQFKEILIDQLQTTVILNLSITHKIALFLFPPANKLTQFSELDKNFIKTEIISYLKPYVQTEIKKEIIKEPSISIASNTMISSYFKNFVTPPKRSTHCDEISNEIHAYESLDVPYDDNFDILQWWHLRQTQFPLLYKLSCKILAGPASCASSEKVFATVKCSAKNNTNIISNPKVFNQLIFLNFNSDENSDIKECVIREKPKIENEIIEQI